MFDQEIQYRNDERISADEFIDLLDRSTLGQRRPVNDRACVEGMVKHGNLLVTARHQERLVGLARSVTDFHYACYLSDLAVDEDYQRRGIGKRLLAMTQQQLGPKCNLILLAAPKAADYYKPLGFESHPRCWILPGE
jgi:ribosomal protein S18 acetylase RimI-like enzyme